NPQRTELLSALIADGAERREDIAAELRESHGVPLDGPYFAVLKLRLDLASGGRTVSDKDGELLQYAMLNIAGELLDKEWDHQAFYSQDREIAIVIQWNEARYGDSSVDKLGQLEMIGRS